MRQIRRLLKIGGRFLGKHSPTILTGLSIGSSVGAVFTGIFATPKAMRIREEELRWEPEATEWQLFTKYWQEYIPTGLLLILSAACGIGSHTIQAHRLAALATVCTLGEERYNSYREKVIETVGKKKDVTIRDMASKEKIKENPYDERNVILTGYGDFLCYEAMTGRYFRSCRQEIDNAVNRINAEMVHNMYASMNDYFDELNIPRVRLGECLGWSVDCLLELYPTSTIIETGEECLIVDYMVLPKEKYNQLF